MIYQFNKIKIDTTSFQIRNKDQRIAVEPQVFDLIVYLIEHKDRMVSRNELFEHVWKGAIVSDTSLSNRIKSARKALDDDGQKQDVIKTQHGRGYQFIAKIKDSNTGNIKLASSSTEDQSVGPLIAVLPLQNLSSDPEQDYVAEGLSEDLTTELARFKNIQVISRHTAFQFDSKSMDVSKLRDKFGIHYIIEGSIRRINDRVRINLQLIDTYNSNHIWAERYDDLFENIYLIQDQIVERIVSIISSELIRVETGRSLQRSTKNLRAYDYFLRGLYYHKTTNLDNLDHAKSMDEFQKAIDLDPHFVRARVWYCCARIATWDELTKERLDLQINDVKTALKMNPGESECHRLLGMLYFYQRSYDLATYHHQQALSLCPNDAYINIKSGMFYSLIGESEKGIDLCQRAIYLNPLHPAWYWRDIGIAFYSAAKYQQAIDALSKNIHADDYDYVLLAANYVALGDSQKAAEHMAKAKELNPDADAIKYTARMSYKDDKTSKLFQQRITKAMI